MTTSKSKSDRIDTVIKKLESLEQYAKSYQRSYPEGNTNHRGLNTGADDYWSEKVQPLIEEIELDLDELGDDIADYTRREDNFGHYYAPVGTVSQNLSKDINYVINKSRNPTDVHALIQHLKKIQRRIEISTTIQQVKVGLNTEQVIKGSQPPEGAEPQENGRQSESNQAKPKLPEARVPSKKVPIDLSNWKKSKSRSLMHDLLDDELREGIRIHLKRYGKQQPTKLKRVLKCKHLEVIAKAIILVKGEQRKYKLDIPTSEIAFDSPKT